MSSSPRAARVAALRQALERRVLVLDGAMGTAIQALNLGPDDFGGVDLEGCNENLNTTRPAAIEGIHKRYFEAGADIAETNSFGSTPLVLAEYGLSEKAFEISKLSAEIARRAADAASTPERPRWVAGSMGPTTKAISITGGVTFDELVAHFHEQARGLHAGGVDYFLIETCQDTRNIKAAILGIEKLFAEGAERIPVAVSGTIEAMGTMLGGQGVEALATSLEHVDLLYIGLNCATGPEFMTDHLRSLARMARTRVAVVPNAGLPDENGHYLETPEMMARTLSRFGEEGWLNLIGGCCGTTDAHIRALSSIAPKLKPRVIPVERRSALSGVDYLEIADDNRPVIVGERTNVLGSKKFKELIRDGKIDEATEIAKAQVKRGAQVIDVCVQDPDRDESADMRAFLDMVIKKVRVPLMIDTTDAKVIDLALTYCQGKSIINSVNLEDGEERFEHVVPIARKYGAALVVGCIDEDKKQAQAITRQRKLDIAIRSRDILTKKYGVAEEDLYFDPLVFPCATGDQNYVGSAVETIEGVRLIKQHLPRCKTVLGISNVSFGLPAAGREVLNSVFLYHCVQAGLDMALVNAEKLERYPQIPAEERKLAEDLIWNRGADPIAAFAAHFRDRKAKVADRSTLPIEERIARCVIEGSKDGLFDDLTEQLKKQRPLDVINGPLMAGMDEVGRLFNANELIVAEVLQSAEVMKAAVAFLEPHMDKADVATRGKVVLATVKGDVHDIGKNLVDIILTNNGFQVVNLGIKVPPEKIIEAVKEHRPDIVGLSGLLVKSAQQMVVTAEDLSRAGVQVPMLVGGAALSANFVDKQIANAYSGTVAYANDAMSGLELAKQITDPERFQKLQGDLAARRAKLKSVDVSAPVKKVGQKRSGAIRPPADFPKPPDLDRHVLTQTPLDQIWGFINPVMLYGRHLGLKSSVVRQIETASVSELAQTEAGRKAIELKEMMDALRAECRTGLMSVKAVYRFYRAASEGNALHLYDPSGAKLTTFEFGRQPGAEGLCLADYVKPASEGTDDTVALFVTTAGAGIRDAAEKFKRQGDYLRCHALQALALETAEAYAELLHTQLRTLWGFPDGPNVDMLDRFKANYRGKRYSFGYPACPRLEDQQQLFSVLRPEEIGVQLTDGCMMDPEASVSAVVFHHPQASYFSVHDLSQG
ncbi:MAG: methionine synthase [Deltaproteobacteria bacterium]|nr:methionine synthase [Deltaproteobacteria bacterium]